MFFRLIFNYLDSDEMMHFDAVAFHKGTHHIAKKFFNLIYDPVNQKFNLLSEQLQDFEDDLIFQAELEKELLATANS